MLLLYDVLDCVRILSTRDMCLCFGRDVVPASVASSHRRGGGVLDSPNEGKEALHRHSRRRQDVVQVRACAGDRSRDPPVIDRMPNSTMRSSNGVCCSGAERGAGKMGCVADPHDSGVTPELPTTRVFTTN